MILKKLQYKTWGISIIRQFLIVITYNLICYFSIFNRTGGMDMALMLVLNLIIIFHTLINVALVLSKLKKYNFKVIEIFIPPLILFLIFRFSDEYFEIMYNIEKILKIKL